MMPLTRSAADSDKEQSDMENQPGNVSESSTNMKALLTLLPQQIERLAQQKADRDARQDECDARRKERFAQQLNERLTERLRLDEMRDVFADQVRVFTMR